MTRTILAALALACALSTAACQTAAVSGTVPLGALSTASLAAAGVPTATATKIGTTVAKAQSYARLACGVVPTASSLANLFLASNGTLATAQALAKVACDAVANSGSYAADMPRRAAQKPPAKGTTVTATAVVNGQPVTVTGTIAR